MSRNEDGFIAHGPQPLDDALNQGVMVSARKIGAPNAARKQLVALKSPMDIG
jgi:hypothetical protein